MATRVLDQLTGLEPVPEPAADALSVSLAELFGVAGGVVVRVPSAYLSALPGTPRGVVRPAVMWDDAVLTVDDGKEQRFSGEQLVWHLAQLCERCGTLLIPVSFSRGLVLVHDGADLVAALDGSYRPFVRGCSHCCGPQAPVPEYLAERDCESRYMRKKKVHNFTQGSPGPWNAGDIIWCLRCGKQAYSTAYLPCFLEGDAGMGMPGV